MHQKQIESIVKKIPVNIGPIDWNIGLVMDLYENSIDVRKIYPVSHVAMDRSELEDFYLPEKIALYYHLKKKGIDCTSGKNKDYTPDFGQRCIRAAEDFWEKFIELNHHMHR